MLFGDIWYLDDVFIKINESDTYRLFCDRSFAEWDRANFTPNLD